MELYDYQKIAVEVLETSIIFGERPLLQAPTGAGKTIIMNELAHRFQRAGSRVIIAAPRRELVYQTAERYFERYGEPAGVIMAGIPENPNLPFQVSSIDTLARRKKTFTENDILIIDEAHHINEAAATYNKVFDNFPGGKMGATATPWTANGSGFEKYFSRLVTTKTVMELIESGRLCKPKFHIVSLSGLEEAKKAGVLDEKKLNKLFTEGKLTGDYVAAWKDHAAGLQTIIFAMNIEHSRQIWAQFSAAGIAAAVIDSRNIILPGGKETKTNAKNRKEVFRMHSEGAFQVLINVDICTEGYDDPGVKCIILARPTQSKIIAIQQTGRGLRTAPGKSECIIIDMANVFLENGLPTDPVPWQIHFQGRPRRKRNAPERLAIEIETGRLFLPRDLPQNINLDLITLSGSERFSIIRKAVRDGRKYGKPAGIIAREFRRLCVETGERPSFEEYCILAAFLGLRKETAKEWTNNIGKKIIF